MRATLWALRCCILALGSMGESTPICCAIVLEVMLTFYLQVPTQARAQRREPDVPFDDPSDR